MGRPRKNDTVCAVEGCDRFPRAWNRCSTHYKAWRKHLPVPPSELDHGTINTYQNLFCRCSDCSAVNTAAHAARYVSMGFGSQKQFVESMPRDLRDRFRDYAAARGRSMRSLAAEALERMMLDEEPF